MGKSAKLLLLLSKSSYNKKLKAGRNFAPLMEHTPPFAKFHANISEVFQKV